MVVRHHFYSFLFLVSLIVVCAVPYEKSVHRSKREDPPKPVPVTNLEKSTTSGEDPIKIISTKTKGTECLCSTEYDPVCGTNGDTFHNECFLKCRALQLKIKPAECIQSRGGFYYNGTKSVTVDGRRCTKWIDNVGVYPLDNRITSDPIIDGNFPELSVIKAKNYCRNPDQDLRGLWCFTGKGEGSNFGQCHIPLCDPRGLEFRHKGMCAPTTTTQFPTPSTSKPPCKDTYTTPVYCPIWAKQGECGYNPRFMHQHCRRSCNVC